MILVITCLVSLIPLTHARYQLHSSSNDIVGENPSWQTSSNRLLDLGNFFYSIKPDSDHVCTENLYLLVLVHTTPENFKERQLIRQNWGSVTRSKRAEVRILFVMGQYQTPAPVNIKTKSTNSIRSRSLNKNGFSKTSPLETGRHKADAVDQLLARENIVYQDILQGSFVDDSTNLTYKHVMSYKWVTEECQQQPAFVLKTDDNVFVEMNHLINFLTAVYGKNPSPSIVCDVVPAGAPHKPRDQNNLDSGVKAAYPKEGGTIDNIPNKKHVFLNFLCFHFL